MAANSSSVASQKETIYVRVPRTHKSEIERYAHKLDVTQNQVIENMIAHFMTLEGAIREDIIGGAYPNIHVESNMGSALECLAWADHAFFRGHVEWSLEGWRSLQQLADQSKSKGLQRLAHYKQMLCYNRIIWGLRDEAIHTAIETLDADEAIDVEQWNATYIEADRAARLGLAHNKMFEQLSDGYYHPVIVYNNACQHALQALCLAEKLVLIQPSHKRQLLSLKSNVPDERWPTVAASKAMWRELGKQWTKGVSEDAVEQIRYTARKAVEEMRVITQKGGTGDRGKPTPVRDESFLLRYSESDEDLIFIMSDPVIKGVYRNVFDAYKRKQKTRYQTFLGLWEYESPQIRGLVEAEQEMDGAGTRTQPSSTRTKGKP
jgi:hypothetical protein